MSLLIIEMTHGHPELALVLAALVGGALGFLPYNFNPAKIILGDSGALFIGYVFATVSIIGVSKFVISISLVIPLIVLALPILDTAVTIVRRTRAGKKISEADRGHFHHQLISASASTCARPSCSSTCCVSRWARSRCSCPRASDRSN